MKFAILVSRFNSFITDRLLAGAVDAIARCGGSMDDVDVVRIPGAWEFPVTLKAVAARKSYDAILCLGAVIRGDTPHFDYVAGETARGLQDAALQTGIPVAFGVLTTDTLEQAESRANKGFDAAMTAIEMARFAISVAN